MRVSDSSKGGGSEIAEADSLEDPESCRRRVRELERILAERDLQDAEDRKELDRLTQAFQPARIRAWCWTAETRLTQYLPIRGDVCDAQGRSASRSLLPEKRLLEAIHPDDRERLAGAWDRAYEEHEPYECEYRLVLPDSEVRHNREIGRPEFDESGHYLGHFGTTQDITDRKRAEEALRRQALVLEQMSDGVIITDLEGRIIDWNPGSERMFGYAKDEVLGETPGVLHRATESERLTAKMIEGASRHGRWVGEIAFVRKDGTEGICETMVVPFYDEQDEPIATIGVNRDVTERKQAENALRAAHDTLERRVKERTAELEREITDRKRAEEALRKRIRSFRLLRNVVLATNEARAADEALQVCLDEVCAFTGWPVGHVYMPIGDGTGELAPTTLWHFDEPERFTVFHQVTAATRVAPGVGLPGRVFASGEPACIVDLARDANFPRAKIAEDLGVKTGFAFPVMVGSEVAAVLEFFSRDAVEPDEHLLEIMAQVGAQFGRVLERKAAEEAVQDRIEQLEEAQHRLTQQGENLIRLADDLRFARDEARGADRAKSEFLAAMSHELRTPLNAIIGFSEIITKENFGPLGSPRYREYANDIHESGQHLLGLINDILDLSKIESGTGKLREEAIKIPEIIRSALKLVRQRAEEGGIKLELELPEQLPALWADEYKLEQILVNLLANAVKFTDAGGEVTLRAWCRMDSGYLLQIADTGIGIASEDIPTALSRFGQVDGDLNRRYEGTGLGLPLTKALVELHGGSLDLQSKVSVGTTVTVRFPAERIMTSLHNADSLNA